MLGVDALNLVMMVAESGMIDSSITEILSRPQFLTAAKSNPTLNRPLRITFLSGVVVLNIR